MHVSVLPPSLGTPCLKLSLSLTPRYRHSETFDLSSNFPSSNLLVRNPAGDTVRSLYTVNDIVKSIVQHNDYARIRLMTAGTKVFGKQEGTEAKREGVETHFRVLSEGLAVVLPFIGPKAIVHADFAALKVFMEGYYPLISGFPEPFRSMISAQGQLAIECSSTCAPCVSLCFSSRTPTSQRELCGPLPAGSARRPYVSVYLLPSPPFPPAHTHTLPLFFRNPAHTRIRIGTREDSRTSSSCPSGSPTCPSCSCSISGRKGTRAFGRLVSSLGRLPPRILS